MAQDFVTVSKTSTFGVELVALVSMARQFKNQLDRVKAIMDHNNNGASFTTIETVFGLTPSPSGQTVYDLVNGTSAAVNGTGQNSNLIALIDRVGG
jgi:hypothetical protein